MSSSKCAGLTSLLIVFLLSIYFIQQSNKHVRFKVDNDDPINNNDVNTLSATSATLMMGGAEEGGGGGSSSMTSPQDSPYTSPIHLPPLPFSHESLTAHLHSAIDDLDNILAIDRWEWEFYDHFEKQFRIGKRNRNRDRTFTV